MIVTVEQQRNLIKVALFLARGKSPVKFDMSSYTRYVDTTYAYSVQTVMPAQSCDVINECGTSCCFAGHGPMVLGNAEEFVDGWATYCEVTFGTDGSELGIDMWSYLFGSQHVNDPLQAACRAMIFLMYPNDYLYRQLQYDKDSIIKGLRKLQRSKLKDIVLKDHYYDRY